MQQISQTWRRRTRLDEAARAVAPATSARPARAAGTDAHDAELSVHDSFAAAEAAWRKLEARDDAIMTPFQGFDWCRAWWRGAGPGRRPFIVIARIDAEVVMVFPLVIAGARLEPMAGALNDYNQPIIRADFLARLDARRGEALMADIAALARAEGAVMACHTKMPATLAGAVNPFVGERPVAYSASAHMVEITPDWEAFLTRRRSKSTRRRLNEKRRRLARKGKVRFARISEADERTRMVATILEWKSAQLVDSGGRNPFADPAIGAFLGQAASDGIIEVFALNLDDEAIAGGFGLARNETFILYQMAQKPGAHARQSPGLLLLTEMMRQASEDGRHVFDCSVGDEPYKLDWSTGRLELLNRIDGFSGAGHLKAAALRAALIAKGQIKATPRLFATLTAINRALASVAPATVYRRLNCT